MSEICREAMDNPNQDSRYSVSGGRNDPNPNWCDCRQGECRNDAHNDPPQFGHEYGEDLFA